MITRRIRHEARSVLSTTRTQSVDVGSDVAGDVILYDIVFLDADDDREIDLGVKVPRSPEFNHGLFRPSPARLADPRAQP